MKILIRLNEFIKIISGFFLGSIIVLVIAQVIFRYVLHIPVSETEELARYALVWAVMLGSTIAVKNKSHIAVGYFAEKFPAAYQKFIKTISYVGIMVFCLLFIVQGWILAAKGMTQLSPATEIPVGFIAISISISGVISLIYSLENYYKDVIKA